MEMRQQMNSDAYSTRQPQPEDVPVELFRMIARAIIREMDAHEKECHEPPMSSQLWRELRSN